MLVWVVITSVALAGVLWGEKRRDLRLVWIFKPLASAAFIAAAVSCGALDSSYGRAVLVAQALSWLGDVFLIRNDKRRWFLLGLVSFLLGHVGYLVAFVMRGVSPTWTASAALAMLCAGFFVLRWLMPNIQGAMKRPVVAYVFVISCMVALAAGTLAARGNPVILIAAGLFYISDLTVARHRFVKAGLINRLVGLPLYYAAQLLFAWTVAAGA